MSSSDRDPAEAPQALADEQTERAAARLKMRNNILSVAVVGAAFALIGALTQGPEIGLGILVGATLATVNLVLFARLGAAFLDQKGASAPFALLGVIKLLGLFFVVFVLLRQGNVPALPFLIGYGALPIGITLSTLTGPKPASR